MTKIKLTKPQIEILRTMREGFHLYQYFSTPSHAPGCHMERNDSNGYSNYPVSTRVIMNLENMGLIARATDRNFVTRDWQRFVMTERGQLVWLPKEQ